MLGDKPPHPRSTGKRTRSTALACYECDENVLDVEVEELGSIMDDPISILFQLPDLSVGFSSKYQQPHFTEMTRRD